MNKEQKGNNRIRTSVPVGGLDTSTPDRMVHDGMMEQLHNLRNSGGTWRNVRPFERHEFSIPESMQGFEIVYQHPAAPDDEYIASRTNDDGTIDLFQVVLDREHNTMRPQHFATTDIYPIYVVEEGAPDYKNHIASFAPVPAEVIVTFNGAPGYFQTFDLTIPQGETRSQSAPCDTRQSYYFHQDMAHNGTIDLFRLFPNQQEAIASLSAEPFARNLPAGIRLSHFGNILIIENLNSLQSYKFLLKNSVYIYFERPAPPRIIPPQELIISDSDVEYGINMYPNNLPVEVPGSGYKPFFNTATGTFYLSQFVTNGISLKTYFWGEICYFACFQLYDGTLTSPSALQICSSEPLECSVEARTYQNLNTKTRVLMYTGALLMRSVGTTNEEDRHIIYRDILSDKHIPDGIDRSGYIDTFSMAIRPFIKILIDSDINKDIIKSLNIYSTRLNPLWDAAKLQKLDSVGGSLIYINNLQDYRADNDLPNQPFYLAKSIPIDDLENGSYSFYFDQNILENIEHNAQYNPIRAHDTVIGNSLDYNSRLHAWQYKDILFSGYGDDFFPNSNDYGQYMMATQLDENQNNYLVQTPTTSTLKEIVDGEGYRVNLVYSRILSYPDYRATKIYDAQPDGLVIDSIDLKSALTNNFSYAIYDGDYETISSYNRTIKVHYVKYSINFSKAIKETNNLNRIAPAPIIEYDDKLLVSAPNNPLSFPLANTYAFGTERNRILAVNSAAIEMSDTKFGEFPLYVFTEEGIYTLQTGSGEVLYSAVVPLNYDRIINPETLAVNYNVLYITERGIHAMFSNQSTLISEPIHNRENYPPLDFLRTASMYYQHTHGEVIIHNHELDATASLYGGAYVFSLDNKTWSTRDFLYGSKRITGNQLVLNKRREIILDDLDNEVPIEASSFDEVMITLVSRPLKLGSLEFKRLETFIPRWIYDDYYGPHVSLEGSADLVSWIPLREIAPGHRDNPELIIRRTPRSFRYLRITVQQNVETGFELSGFDIEYYLRFLHRLR